MNVNGNFKDNLMGKKKVIFIGCLIFAVALIAAILHMVSGGGKDSAKNIYYADKVSVITGNGSGTVNRFAGVVEAQDTLKISLSEGQKVRFSWKKGRKWSLGRNSLNMIQRSLQ